MSTASDLIERMEQEAGCRWDENNGNNMAMAGAMSRLSGNSNYRDRDDVAAGVVIQYNNSPAGIRKHESDKMLTAFLVGGISPDTLKDLLG